MPSNVPYGINNLQSNINYAQMQPQFYPQPTQAPSGGGGGFGLGKIAGGILQTGVGIADWIKGAKEYKRYKKETESALAGLPQYTQSMYAKQDLANAQANNNAIDPSILMQYNGLQQQQANTAAVGQRNAMSGAEAINAAIVGQNIVANQTPQLAQQQAQMNIVNRQALSQALSGMTQEQQNVFNSKNAIANQMLNYKMGLMGAAAARKASGINNTVGGVSAVGNSFGGI